MKSTNLIITAFLLSAYSSVSAEFTEHSAGINESSYSNSISSRTYKNPICNFIVKHLENEIAETTTSLKNCGDQLSALGGKALADKSKECKKYSHKLKFTKANLLRVKE